MFEVNTLHNCDCSAIMSEILQDKTRKYCVVTDPPFNIGYHYKTYKDKMDADEYYKWLAGIVGDCCAVVHSRSKNKPLLRGLFRGCITRTHLASIGI
jgi:DNA modification methylase